MAKETKEAGRLLKDWHDYHEQATKHLALLHALQMQDSDQFRWAQAIALDAAEQLLTAQQNYLRTRSPRLRFEDPVRILLPETPEQPEDEEQDVA